MGAPSGYLYGIVHPSWPGYVKIGKARSPRHRLNTYQTGDPHRRYSLAWAIHTPAYHHAEWFIHEHLLGLRVGNTEWFQLHPDDAFNLVRSLLHDA